MEEKFIEANDIRKIAEDVKNNEKDLIYINLNNIEFCRIIKQTRQGEHLFAFCQRLSDLSRFICKKDYVLVFYPVFDTLNDEQKRYIVEHEMRHIDPENKKVISHDFAEFRAMIKKFGLDYLEIIEQAEEKIKKLKEIEKKKKQIKKLEEEQDEILEEKTTEEDEKMKNINKEEDVDYDPDEEIDKDSDEPE